MAHPILGLSTSIPWRVREYYSIREIRILMFPVLKVEASAREPGRMGAQVELVRHTHRPHTMVERELVAARSLNFTLL